MQVSTVFGNPLPERAASELPTPKRFRILVLADFGGAVQWGQPVSVDRDNFEAVFESLNVRVRIPTRDDAPPLEVVLREYDDFHPDRLFDQLELFASLRTRRRRLQNDATFDEESAAILAAESDSKPAAGDTTTAQPATFDADAKPAASFDPADLLNEALEQTEQSLQSGDEVVRQVAEGTLNIDDYVRRVVAPYVLDKSNPQKAEFIAGVDDAIAAAMRDLLHHPEFQRVEAAWLGLRMLVRRLETSSTLQIAIVNVSKDELTNDLVETDELTKSRAHGVLVDAVRQAEADPWTIVIGDYVFDSSAEDVEALGRLANIHRAAGSVFLAGASPRIVGCDDLAKYDDPQDWPQPTEETRARWQSLRELSSSSHVALSLPGILARSPYGKSTDPIESFRFEEIPDGDAHADYLWMNASFGVGVLLGESFSVGGWSLSGAWTPRLGELPTFVYSADGESVFKPCGEVELAPGAAAALAAAGLTTIHSVRNQDAVLITHLRSIADSQEPLSAAWS